jgi:hypothetical protein
VGRRCIARGGPGGGERIQALRSVRTRLTTALGSVVLLGAIVLYSAASADRVPEVVAGVGAAGVLVVAAAAAVRWPSLLPLGFAGVGASYAVFLSFRPGGVDPRAPLVAGGFFAAAELAYWAVERRLGVGEGPVLRRLVFVGAGALGTALVGGVFLVLVGDVTAGLGLEALGLLAAVAALAAVAFLAARARA